MAAKDKAGHTLEPLAENTAMIFDPPEMRRVQACISSCAGISTEALEGSIIDELTGDVKILLATLKRGYLSGEVMANVTTIQDTLARIKGE